MRYSEEDIRPQGELVFVDGIEVRVNRKRMKSMRMRVVPPDGHVEVNVPVRMPVDDVKAFVRAKRTWVAGEQQRLLDSPQTAAELASDAEKKAWREVVEAFAPALVEKWAAVLGVAPGALAYRNMRSRWGSCQPSTGRICLNTRLALYPPECLEYVVVHELCHLREHGHTPRFWALVESCLPDYRTAKRKLSE
ncbi:MAG: M48 family metallopeptidase [Eggerthellaceae bacterium]|nr:M48 family metallopeptidase [Eggerthellaceae bacterium]